ncbi:MAG: hypothetical protein PG981_001305 [Wolbachia endosymbiont of Ctenocephalides orientis wCori]|nr:MAG: hypothetical protein PG981_001305 [Wolbachia endosymbiont of Ctenocephalides orientis wCori]
MQKSKLDTEEQRVYLLHQQAGIYEGAENYGLLSKITGLTEDTIKTLAKGTADNLVIPVGSYVATKIVVPVGKHVAEEIVVPLGKYVAEDIALPIGKYVQNKLHFL